MTLLAPEKTTTYDEWERARDVAPILYLSSVDGRTPLLRYALRRRVYEKWIDENGRKMGRWTWEYRA